MRVSTVAPAVAVLFGACCVAITAQALTTRILFSRAGPGEPGEMAIFVANSDGTAVHALGASSGSLDYNPAWFPNGESIVFTSERDGSAELYRVNLNGSGLARLTNDPAYDDQPSVSPDGGQIVFVSTRGGGTADLWVLNTSTLTVRPLTSGPGGDFRPAWSPDGNWIAFSSDRASNMPMAHGRWEHLDVNDVYIVRPDGTGLRRFQNKEHSCGSPKWTVDSRQVIAYCAFAEDMLPFRAPAQRADGGAVTTLTGLKSVPEGETRIVSIDIESGRFTDLAVGSGIKVAPGITPNGVFGYVKRNPGEQGIFYSDGKSGPRGEVRYAAWSPDGKRVAFHKRLVKPRSGWQKVWSRDQRYELVMSPNMPSFHPSGERFVTQGVAPNGPLGRGINIVESGSGVSRVLFQREGKHALAPQWSPRGDLIAFGLGTFTLFTGGLTPKITKPEDRVDGGGQVAVINPDGSGFRELTSGTNNNGFPSIAPDGNRLVYRTFGPDGNGLRILNLRDGSVALLTNYYDNFPFWSPRGDVIMFSRQEHGNFDIYTIKPDGTSLKRLTTSPGNDAHMGWSPDGEWIAFASSRMGFKDESLYTIGPQPYGEIFVMRYDGSDLHQLTDNQWEDGAPAWQRSK
jgi:TolB protein